MRVQFIKPHPLFVYSEGDEATLTKDHGQMLIESGFAIPVEETQTATLPQAETATHPRKPKK